MTNILFRSFKKIAYEYFHNPNFDLDPNLDHDPDLNPNLDQDTDLNHDFDHDPDFDHGLESDQDTDIVYRDL